MIDVYCNVKNVHFFDQILKQHITSCNTLCIGVDLGFYNRDHNVFDIDRTLEKNFDREDNKDVDNYVCFGAI